MTIPVHCESAQPKTNFNFPGCFQRNLTISFNELELYLFQFAFLYFSDKVLFFQLKFFKIQRLFPFLMSELISKRCIEIASSQTSFKNKYGRMSIYEKMFFFVYKFKHVAFKSWVAWHTHWRVEKHVDDLYWIWTSHFFQTIGNSEYV